MGRRVIAIGAAILLGIVGVVAVVLYANGADQRAVAGAEPRTVFVSEKAVPANTTLNDAVRDGLIVQTSLAAKAVPSGSLTAVTDQNKSLVAVTEIPPGEYILTARFGTTPQANTAIKVPNGQVAMSLTLSDPARVGTFLVPGSKIILYETIGGGGNGATQRETYVLFPEVLVLAVGTAADPGAEPTGEATAASGSNAALVTLALTPKQGAQLAQALQSGPLHAGLLGHDITIDAGLVVNDQNARER